MMGWMAPLRHQCAKLVFSENHQEREPSMSEITTIGLDLAKHVFQVHGVDAEGTTVLRRRLRRNQVLDSSADFRAALSGWKPVQRPTTGRASWPQSGMRCD
jgi:hypothetical protein